MAKIKAGKKRPSSSSSTSTNTTPASASILAQTSTGRIRRYLKSDQGKYWNPNSPDTPEGRLSKFNMEDWYPPVKDDNGHAVSVRVDIHPVVLEELSAHCNSRNLPFGGSIQQAIRVCIQEMLPILRKLNPMPNSHMALIENLTYLNANAEIMWQYETQYITGRQRVQKLIAMDARNEARKLAHDLIALANRITIKELKKKYVGELKREFKGLLKEKAIPVKANVLKNSKKKPRRREEWE